MTETVHSLDPIIDDDAVILILGSMPGVMSLNQNEYYANPRNHFWTILYKIFKEPETGEYSERKAFLKAHGLALWDVIGSCKRKGSSDSTISEIEVNDIEGLLRRYPGIKLIILNGSKAEATYRRYVHMNRINSVEAIRAPSTSPVPGRNVRSYDEKLQDWKQIVESVFIPVSGGTIRV